MGTLGRWRCLGLVALLPVLGCSGSASGGELVHVNERLFLRSGDALIPRGGGCESMRLPASGGGGSGGGTGNGDISVAEGSEGDAFVVRVFGGGMLLASRSYDVAMLESGRMDEFTVTTPSGAVYDLRYWGGACSPLDAWSP